jgi:SAM-dependent methyltransferase
MSGPFRDYDAFAEAYAERTQSNAYNAYYERPAIRALLGPLAGARVLDAGCAAGEHALWLVERGAVVTAIDISEPMLHLARTRLEHRAVVLAADIGQPLPFGDASFDVVFSSLTLHYVADWEPLFSEFARVLMPGGSFVFSTHHPSMEVGLADYFTVREIDDRWSGFGAAAVRVRFFHRPLHAILTPLLNAGFRIDAISEPEPDAELAARDPDADRVLRTKPFFLFVRATKTTVRDEKKPPVEASG